MINKDNPKYFEVINDTNEREYTIDSTKMQPGEQIICPHDDDMIITLAEGGEVLVTKKSFTKNCFFR